MRSILLVSIFAALSAIPAAAQSFGPPPASATTRSSSARPRPTARRAPSSSTGRSGDGWSQVARLTADDGVIGDRFGAFIATAGNRMIVGAPNADDGMGAVYAFERAEDGTWRQTAKLVAPERAPDDQFGVELGFDGELALASKADGDSTTGNRVRVPPASGRQLAAGGHVPGAGRRRLRRGLGPHAGRDSTDRR